MWHGVRQTAGDSTSIFWNVQFNVHLSSAVTQHKNKTQKQKGMFVFRAVYLF